MVRRDVVQVHPTPQATRGESAPSSPCPVPPSHESFSDTPDPKQCQIVALAAPSDTMTVGPGNSRVQTNLARIGRYALDGRQ